jgi:hypothetical protein
MLRCPDWVSESQLAGESGKSSNAIGRKGLRTFVLLLYDPEHIIPEWRPRGDLQAVRIENNHSVTL